MKLRWIALPLLAVTLCLGCRSTTPPTAFEKTFVDYKTNYVQQLVLLTNVVTLFQTNPVVKEYVVTNSVGVPVQFFVTNMTTIITYQTNLVAGTNLMPVVTATPGEVSKLVAGTAGGIANTFLPGTGALVVEGILGLIAIFAGYRARQFSGQNSVLSQSAGVLAQIIETGREIMSKTPQGQNAANEFTAWMVKHQAETQTIAQISQLVKDTVDNEQAKKAADQILALIQPPKT